MEERSSNYEFNVRLLTFKDVQRLTGLSRSTIYRQIKTGEFPKPKMLSQRKVGFLSRDLECWLDERKCA